MTMIDLIVHMDCAGCESKIKKALQKLKGVDDVEVDINMQKVTVMGWADQEKILKAIRKTGRKADLWPYSPENNHNATIINDLYFHQNHNNHHHSTVLTAFEAPILSYNYLTSNNNNSSYYNYSNTSLDLGVVDHHRRGYDLNPYDNAADIFSDENAHACSIM